MTGMSGVVMLPGKRMMSLGGGIFDGSFAICALAMLAAPRAHASRLSFIFDFMFSPICDDPQHALRRVSVNMRGMSAPSADARYWPHGAANAPCPPSEPVFFCRYKRASSA